MKVADNWSFYSVEDVWGICRLYENFVKENPTSFFVYKLQSLSDRVLRVRFSKPIESWFYGHGRMGFYIFLFRIVSKLNNNP